MSLEETFLLELSSAITPKSQQYFKILCKITKTDIFVLYINMTLLTRIKSKIVCKFLSYYRPEHCHLDYPARRSPVKGKGYASASRTLDWMPDFAGDSC